MNTALRTQLTQAHPICIGRNADWLCMDWGQAVKAELFKW